MDSFKRFITQIYKMADLKDEHIYLLTNRNEMKFYSLAFTHPSYNSEHNYQFLEFKGDPIVNYCLIRYISYRFPKIESINWLTKIFHKFESKKILSHIAEVNNFLPHIKYGDQIKKIINNKNYKKTETYLSMLEDVIEAFFSAIFEVLSKNFGKAVAMRICFIILKNLADKIEFKINHDDIFDPRTRLKELFDSQNWSFKDHNSTNRQDGKYISKVWYTDEEGNDVGLSVYTSYDKETSKIGAAKKAIYILRTAYRIQERLVEKYIEPPTEVPSWVSPLNIENFYNFMVEVLRYGDINDSTIPKILDEDFLYETRLSLVTKSYDPTYNNGYYLYEGVELSNLLMVDYISDKFSHLQDEGTMTIIKNYAKRKNIYVGYQISKILDFSKFVDYHLEQDENFPKTEEDFEEEKKDIISKSFKSFLGSMSYLLTKKYNIGIAYKFIFQLYQKCMDEINIFKNADDIYPPKSRLKEIYDRYQWKINELLICEQIEDTNDYVCRVYGYLKGNRRPYEKNKILLVEKKGKKPGLEQAVSKKALEILDLKYNIRDEKNEDILKLIQIT